MRLRSDLPEKDITQGFLPQFDIFKREDLANRLTGLLVGLEHGSVCLLDGRWGSGKTTFVRQWSSALKTANIPSVYFDAFASDYLESPFEALVGQFVTAAADAKRLNQSGYRNFISRAAKVGRTLASVSAKVGVKFATLGAVNAADLNELSDMGSTLADGLGDVSEEAMKKILESHADRKEQFSQLRASLDSLPFLLKPDQDKDDTPPLIVFIDELDRCRPDFSLGVVEILKHFFRADHIHFVLVTNRAHLEASVSQRYGSGVASAEYLEKFYDFVVFFDHTYDRHDEGSVSNFISKCMNQILPIKSRETQYVHEYVRDISLAFRLSLRQIQSFSINVALAHAAMREREFRPSMLVCFLAAIKTLRGDLFSKARNGVLTWREVEDFIKSGIWDKFDVDRAVSVFRYHLDPDINVNNPEWQHFGRSLWDYNLERERVVPYLATSVLDRFASPFSFQREG